jgi:hypothetical protein
MNEIKMSIQDLGKKSSNLNKKFSKGRDSKNKKKPWRGWWRDSSGKSTCPESLEMKSQ